jgi:hypothetical protein
MIADTYKSAGDTKDFISYENFLGTSDIWEIDIVGNEIEKAMIYTVTHGEHRLLYSATKKNTDPAK